MRIHLVLASTAVLLLAACGDSGSDKAGTSGDSGGGAGMQLQPGEWEMKTEVVNVSAPGMPPQVAAQMKQPAQVTRDCMTPEEAKGPKGDMFAGNKAANCTQNDFNWSGGKIHGVLTCTAGNQGKVTMTMDGSYGAQNIDMTMNTKSEAQGMVMDMEMRVTGRRIGECPAGKA